MHCKFSSSLFNCKKSETSQAELAITIASAYQSKPHIYNKKRSSTYFHIKNVLLTKIKINGVYFEIKKVPVLIESLLYYLLQ